MRSTTTYAVNSMIFECQAPHWASSRMERSSTSRRSATLVRHLLNQVSGIPTSAGMDYMFRTDTGDDALEREVAAQGTSSSHTIPGRPFSTPTGTTQRSAC